MDNKLALFDLDKFGREETSVLQSKIPQKNIYVIKSGIN
jgi:hypothetical protein